MSLLSDPYRFYFALEHGLIEVNVIFEEKLHELFQGDTNFPSILI